MTAKKCPQSKWYKLTKLDIKWVDWMVFKRSSFEHHLAVHMRRIERTFYSFADKIFKRCKWNNAKIPFQQLLCDWCCHCLVRVLKLEVQQNWDVRMSNDISGTYFSFIKSAMKCLLTIVESKQYINRLRAEKCFIKYKQIHLTTSIRKMLILKYCIVIRRKHQ